MISTSAVLGPELSRARPLQWTWGSLVWNAVVLCPSSPGWKANEKIIKSSLVSLYATPLLRAEPSPQIDKVAQGPGNK